MAFTGVVALLFIGPLVAFYKITKWLVSLVLHEDVRGKVVLITGASSGIGEVNLQFVDTFLWPTLRKSVMAACGLVYSLEPTHNLQPHSVVARDTL